MSSVVFIIRVPYYQENSKSLKSEGDNEPESSEGTKEENVKPQTDVKGVKFENSENRTDKALDQNEAEINDDTKADVTSDDVEMFTAPLNLAKVFTRIRICEISITPFNN
jgi:hypothetical protein